MTARKKFKVMSIFGTRPEAVKLAPVIEKIESSSRLDHTLTVTGQQRELLDQMLVSFELTPDIDLELMEEDQHLSDLTARVLAGLREVLAEHDPGLVLVHGDTATTLAASLAAYHQQIAVGHVEAGLRSYDRYSPFPEEMNRQLTDVLAELHFAPTSASRDNLLAEGIEQEKILVTGNTVIDAVQRIAGLDPELPPRLQQLKNKAAADEIDLVMLTAHRRENFGGKMKKIFAGVRELAGRHERVEVVFPVHLNPGVKKPAEVLLKDQANVHLTEPLAYSHFISLMSRARLVLTDSGGIQEEAPALDVPVVLMRENTERPEALRAGTVLKAGTDKESILKTAGRLLEDDQFHREVRSRPNPYGDGRASERILQGILHNFELSEEPPDEFGV